jgi:hypothetical protein
MGTICKKDQTQLKYIFVAGAPGSKWSSVVKNIYYSPTIDRSDYRDHWTYYHDASGQMELMHLGAYFDPGMECNLPEDLSDLSREQLEEIFDAPFSTNSTGTRIIKSHIFANNIGHLRRQFPEVHIVMVYRNNDSCLGWWVKCGHFDITYPSYAEHYQNLREMANIIAYQNAGILEAWDIYDGIVPRDNQELASILKLDAPPAEYQQNYHRSDVKVKVI